MLCILQRLPCPVLKLNTRCSCPRPIGASASDHDVVDPVHSVPLHWDWQGVQSALFFITHFLTCLLSYLHWWSGDQSSTKFIGTTLELKRPPERRRPTTQQIQSLRIQKCGVRMGVRGSERREHLAKQL